MDIYGIVNEIITSKDVETEDVIANISTTVYVE